MALLSIGLFSQPTFAEVNSIQANNELFYKGEQIEFSGTVEENSTGLITIVIRDFNNEFILLTQAIINHDDTFEKSMKVDEVFTKHGTYTATGFILNMTKGPVFQFNVLTDEKSIMDSNDIKQNNIENTNFVKPIIDNNQNVETESTSIKQNIEGFVDVNKDPSYYIERYYSEPTYKSWFDRNYPHTTIEKAVGYTEKIQEPVIQEIINRDFIPKAQASSIIEPIKKIEDNSDIPQIILALAGLGILFGAVYGVKIQVDNNSKQILLNRDTIKKKIISPMRRSNPKEILQTRLVKGEITLKEYELLKSKLN